MGFRIFEKTTAISGPRHSYLLIRKVCSDISEDKEAAGRIKHVFA